MNILSICGSIRENSSNYLLIKSVEGFLPHSAKLNYFKIKDLPYFDPDRQFSPHLPDKVSQLRSLAKDSDCLLITTPEYAHGIPGVLKNALEWLVCEESMQKKVAIIIATPSGGEFVKQHLCETIRNMDMRLDEKNTLMVRNAKNQIDRDGQISDQKLLLDIKTFIDRL